MTAVGAGCLALFAVVLAAVFWTHPALLWGIPAVAAFIFLADAVYASRHDRRMARLAAGRRGESICTFARQCGWRAVDPWIIRASYEELQAYCRYEGGTLPLRATDRFTDDLDIDPEDLGDIAEDIASRSGRSWDGYENNPHQRFTTVHEMVLFFNHQPGTAETVRRLARRECRD